jgi:spore photoproduct lyase
MQELVAKFDRVYIHRDSVDSLAAQRVFATFPREKIEITSTRPFASASGDLTAAEFARSKRLLYLCRYPGKFFKRCPGSRPGLACCNYFVLNWGLQCDMNCSYCYLQSFINTPVLTIYTNLDDALRELAEIGGELRQQGLRVGTGETVDSLSLDELTHYSRRLIHFFSDYPQWTLEFKTKSAKVDQFLEVPHAGNVVVSWSLNPQHIISHEEHGTASLAARLAAARRCRRHNYKLAFHMDPLIWHPDWRRNYAGLVQEITAAFTPEEVSYMSVGALRFQPEQRHMMRERFGLKSYVTQGETFPSADGKMRYDSALRQNMFQFIMEQFAAVDSRWRIFMCMETPETWLKTVGQSPFKNEKMDDLFDSSVLHRVRVAQDHSVSVEPV